MKYIKSCLIITMLAGIGYADHCLGDLNCDEEFNVLDLVTLSSCVLVQNCGIYQCGLCSPSDVNGDGGWNVLDIVTLANCVLAGTCGE